MRVVSLWVLALCFLFIAALPSNPPTAPNLDGGSQPDATPPTAPDTDSGTQQGATPPTAQNLDGAAQPGATQQNQSIEEDGTSSGESPPPSDEEPSAQNAAGSSERASAPWVWVLAGIVIVSLLGTLLAILWVRRTPKEEPPVRREHDLKQLRSLCAYAESLRAREYDAATIEKQLRIGDVPEEYVRIALQS